VTVLSRRSTILNHFYPLPIGQTLICRRGTRGQIFGRRTGGAAGTANGSTAAVSFPSSPPPAPAPLDTPSAPAGQALLPTPGAPEPGECSLLFTLRSAQAAAQRRYRPLCGRWAAAPHRSHLRCVSARVLRTRRLLSGPGATRPRSSRCARRSAKASRNAVRRKAPSRLCRLRFKGI